MSYLSVASDLGNQSRTYPANVVKNLLEEFIKLRSLTGRNPENSDPSSKIKLKKLRHSPFLHLDFYLPSLLEINLHDEVYGKLF